MRIATVAVALLTRVCTLQKYYLNLCRAVNGAHRQLYRFMIIFPTLSVNIFLIHTKTHAALQLIHMSTLMCCSIHFSYTQCPLYKEILCYKTHRVLSRCIVAVSHTNANPVNMNMIMSVF